MSKYGVISGPYSVRIQENSDQKKLLIWTLFTQCNSEAQHSRYLRCMNLNFVILGLDFLDSGGMEHYYVLMSKKLFSGSKQDILITLRGFLIT